MISFPSLTVDTPMEPFPMKYHWIHWHALPRAHHRLLCQGGKNKSFSWVKTSKVQEPFCCSFTWKCCVTVKSPLKLQHTFTHSTQVASYLQPLGLVAVSSCPGVDLALFVQPGLPRLPGEHVHVESPEDAGGCDLVVLDMARLHSQWFRAA